MDIKTILNLLQLRIDDMHLFHTSRETSAQFVVSLISVAVGMWLPRYLHQTSNIGSAVFVFVLGGLVNAFGSNERKAFFLGRLFTMAFYGISVIALVLSIAQVVAGESDIGVYSDYPYNCVKILLILQGVDCLLFGLINPAKASNDECSNIPGDIDKKAEIFETNAKKGKLGNARVNE